MLSALPTKGDLHLETFAGAQSTSKLDLALVCTEQIFFTLAPHLQVPQCKRWLKAPSPLAFLCSRLLPPHICSSSPQEATFCLTWDIWDSWPALQTRAVQRGHHLCTPGSLPLQPVLDSLCCSCSHPRPRVLFRFYWFSTMSSENMRFPAPGLSQGGKKVLSQSY